MGEADNGPGGYFGHDLLSFDRCLCGGFGAEPPTRSVGSTRSDRGDLSEPTRSSPRSTRSSREPPDDDIFDGSEDHAWIFAEPMVARQEHQTLFDKIGRRIASASWRSAYAKCGSITLQLG